jgi:chemotaxis protein MotA
MFSIIGLVIVMFCIFGVFVIFGGNLDPIIEAAPHEVLAIGGAAVGAMFVGNGLDVIKGVGGGMGKVFAGPKYHRQDYLDTIFLVSKLLKILRVDGPVALESHVESPEGSAIFGEYPKLMKDHTLIHMITDTIRLMVISSGNLNPYAVEEVLDTALKAHHHHEMKPVEALAATAGACPALGIVACVLGVVKTMSSIDQPPAVLGALIGSALVGTFMGVLLAYGVIEPMGNRLKQILEEDAEIYVVVKQLIVATLHGHPQPLVIEAARSCISSHANKPDFGEVFDGLRGK